MQRSSLSSILRSNQAYCELLCDKETLTWGKNDFNWLQAAPLYYFGGAEEKMPPQWSCFTKSLAQKMACP